MYIQKNIKKTAFLQDRNKANSKNDKTSNSFFTIRVTEDSYVKPGHIKSRLENYQLKLIIIKIIKKIMFFFQFIIFCQPLKSLSYSIQSLVASIKYSHIFLIQFIKTLFNTAKSDCCMITGLIIGNRKHLDHQHWHWTGVQTLSHVHY